VSVPRTTVIAEIGENHVGDWDRARRMVAEAARTGAQIVKFQSYRGSDVAEDDPEKEWFHQVELPDAMHLELAELARANGVQFLSTPFTLERARFLCERVGLTSIKVGSSEMLNLPLLDYLNGRAQTVYLSTGMATLEEVRQAVARLGRIRRLVILHCVTQYPLQDADANLRAIPLLRNAFPQHEVGYSDHTIGLLAPVVAVSLGATVIEKHFTLDKTLPGTDHILSVTPEELRQMIGMIRRAEELLGAARKEPVAAERVIREAVRTRFPKQAAERVHP